MTFELENLILTIDTHEEANKREKTRVQLIENWFTSQGAIVEHEELPLCDYVFVGKFRNQSVHLGIEYKTWDNFLTDSIEDMEDKLTRSQEIYDTVALFIETGNYTFKPNLDNCHCVLDYSGATKMSLKQNGNPEPQSKTLAAFEGFCDTLQSNGIHVRQLRSEAQFPYSVYNLLVYSTHPHQLKLKSTRNGCSEHEKYIADYTNMLLNLPGVGIKRIKKVMIHYPNLFWLCNASEESLIAVMGKQVGRTINDILHNHSLETNEWKNNYFQDGQDKIQCQYLHKPCNQVNAYDCVGKICEHHPDYSNFSEKIKAAIVDYLTEEYPHALSVDELCNHFNIEQGDIDKERFLVYLKELVWERKITNTVTDEFQVVHSHSANDMRQQPKFSHGGDLNDFNNKTLQSQCDPTEGTNSFLTPLHIVPSVDDNDKSTGFNLPPLISPVLLSNHSGSISSPQQQQSHDTQDVPSPSLHIQRPDVQGMGLNQVLIPTLDVPVPATLPKKSRKQKKDLKLASSLSHLPSSALTSDKFQQPDIELFGKTNPDWNVDTYKMSSRAQLEIYLQSPHTLQECVDIHSQFASGTIYEHIARMKREGVIIEFDNKTIVMKGKGI